jgi:adenylylsulfate kinase
MTDAPGVIVWITGLPSAGKSTLAGALAERLTALGRRPCVLDGDEVRAALVPAPGYGEDARGRFYATLGNLALLLAGQGHVVLVPATSNRAEYRDAVRSGAGRFIEVFVDVSLEECARRDAKGLYAASEGADVVALPGVGATYERPGSPDVVAHGGQDGSAVERIIAAIEHAPA